jgi:hypothetical protein
MAVDLAVGEDGKKKERRAPLIEVGPGVLSVRERSRAHVALSTGGHPRATFLQVALQHER